MNLNKNLLCMKWDEFDHFVVNGLSNLYQRDELADVTLICDGRSFKSHRVILSMWSSYFKDVFATAPSYPHPVIILRETTSTDLELILRFIYQGQLFVPYEDADRFLKTAEYFQIAGLREMRGHSPSSANSTQSVSGSASFPSNNASFASSTNSNNISKSHNNSMSSNGAAIQSFGSAGVPFVPVNSSSGIPVRIISNSNSPLSSTSSSLHHQHSSSSPVSIISDNASHSQGPFSTNVIKSHTRSNQRQPQIPLRSSSPIHQSTHKQSYQHSIGGGNTSTTVKQSQEGVVYQASQPVLIVQHQSKGNDYHHGNKDLIEPGRNTEQVVVLESIGSGNQMITSLHQESSGLTQSLSNPSTTYTVYNQSQPVIHENHSGQEEVLGLAYLHDNDRSPHSHIIQEAAAAAGVTTGKSDLMETSREPTYISTATTSVAVNSSVPYTKPNSVVLTTTTTTPVYAVKRLPPNVVPSTSESNRNAASSSSKQIIINSSEKNLKTKKKKQPTSPNAGSSNDNLGAKKIDFVSCPKCKKRVKSTSLKVHMKRTHLEEGTVLVCPICSKQISSKGVYYKHMYVHRQKSENADTKLLKTEQPNFKNEPFM